LGETRARMTKSGGLLAAVLTGIFAQSMSSISQTQDVAAWKGQFIQRDEFVEVRNPKQPILKEGALRFIEELTIGTAEGGLGSVFSMIPPRGIDVDDQGRIYVVDAKDCVVRVFDASGGYFYSFAKKGQGPGELQGPWQIILSANEEVIIEELLTRRLNHYTLEGVFRKATSLVDAWIADVVLDSLGNIYGKRFRNENNTDRIISVHKYGPDLRAGRQIHSTSVPLQPPNPFLGGVHCAITPDDCLVCTDPRRYELSVYSEDGVKIRLITRDFDPVEVTKEEIEERLKGQVSYGGPPLTAKNFPKYYPPIYGIHIDDQGRIFIATWEMTPDRKGQRYDVFDKNGRFLAQAILRFRPSVWKNGRVYGSVEDENGYPFVKRYRVVWTGAGG
jgi:hypothetical protein